MVEFKIKDVAKNIETSTQYIYQIMPELIEKKMAYRNEKNKPIIYDIGVEYLRNKRIENFKVEKNNFKTFESISNEKHNINRFNNFQIEEERESIVAIYKNLYEEQKKETEYWKEMYIDKDRKYNEITSSLLLSQGIEDQPKKKKWGFWNKG